MKRILVIGAGNVGRTCADLLAEIGEYDVTLADAAVNAGAARLPVVALDATDEDALITALKGKDMVLNAAPYFLAIKIASAAARLGVHYFDLTEDVPTTQHIIQLAKSATSLLAPQCGLAPGFVGIVGADLIGQFDTCRSCKMRVGALPQHPTGLMGYSFNWSPEGVVNEYLNDCEVLEDGERKWVSPMEWVEKLHIGGIALEAFTTSGGLGTMCETYHGRVPNIDYKTIRYPGHVELMNFFFHELLMRERRKEAGEILVNAKPPVSDDVVYVHVSAEGRVGGRPARREFVRSYYPMEVGGRLRTAISWTTASSVVAVIEMVREGLLPAQGFLKQEDVPLKAFLKTRSGAAFDGGRV